MSELLSEHETRRLAQVVEHARRRVVADVIPLRPDVVVTLLDEEALRARETLIVTNRPLVFHIAREYAVRHQLAVDELAQEGFLGLLQAVDSYDWRRGPFSAFASKLIRRAVAQSAMLRCGQLHVTVRQLSALLDEEKRDVVQPPVSLEARADSGWDIPCERAEQHLSHTEQDLTWMLAQLDPMSRLLVERRFGFGCEPATLAQLVVLSGLTTRQVRTRLEKALATLRRVHLEQAA